MLWAGFGPASGLESIQFRVSFYGVGWVLPLSPIEPMRTTRKHKKTQENSGCKHRKPHCLCIFWNPLEPSHCEDTKTFNAKCYARKVCHKCHERHSQQTPRFALQLPVHAAKPNHSSGVTTHTFSKNTQSKEPDKHMFPWFGVSVTLEAGAEAEGAWSRVLVLEGPRPLLIGGCRRQRSLLNFHYIMPQAAISRLLLAKGVPWSVLAGNLQARKLHVS